MLSKQLENMQFRINNTQNNVLFADMVYCSIYRVTSLYGTKSKVLAYGYFKSGSVELIICWKQSSKFYIYRRKSVCLKYLQSFAQRHIVADFSLS